MGHHQLLEVWPRIEKKTMNCVICTYPVGTHCCRSLSLPEWIGASVCLTELYVPVVQRWPVWPREAGTWLMAAYSGSIQLMECSEPYGTMQWCCSWSVSTVTIYGWRVLYKDVVREHMECSQQVQRSQDIHFSTVDSTKIILQYTECGRFSPEAHWSTIIPDYQIMFYLCCMLMLK